MNKISIKLTPDQKNEILGALNNKTVLSLYVKGSQILADHDFLPISNKQSKELFKAMMNNDIVKLSFTKQQVQRMKQQIGSGILDSLSGLYNSFKSTVSTGYNKTKNYFTQPKPKDIELKDFSGRKKTINSKAQQFFDTPKKVNTPIFSLSEMARFEKLKNMPEPKHLQPKEIKFEEPRKPKIEPYNFKTPDIKIIKNKPLTPREHAIAQWRMNSRQPTKSFGEKLGNALDSGLTKYDTFIKNI